MITLYYILVMLTLLLLGPSILIIFSKTRKGLKQKLGIFSPKQKNKFAREKKQSWHFRVWFHAVSVGEFNAVLPLLQEFHEEFPQIKLFVSTSTATGQQLAKEKVSNIAEIFYFPFDIPWINRKILSTIKPDLVAIVETEIWPGFLTECKNRSIPIVLINGRLSPKSFAGYMRWQWFFRPIINKFHRILVQSKVEFDRFEALLGNKIKTKIKITGNLKFDGLKAIDKESTQNLAKQINLPKDLPLIIAGSTHEQEESLWLSLLQELNYSFRLILVPRHPERFERVAKLIENYGFKTIRYSQNEKFDCNSNKQVYLLDTIGLLNSYYSIADIAFVGGTFVPIGGHNLSEPYIYKTPVICGPHIFKTKDTADKLVEHKSLTIVKNKEELKHRVSLLLSDSTERELLGKNGYEFVCQSQGAVRNTIQELKTVMSEYGIISDGSDSYSWSFSPMNTLSKTSK